MSQCSQEGTAEVQWDIDSPTPSAWKREQGPRRGGDDSSTSPKPKRIVRKLPLMHLASSDYPQFEESKREATEMIKALQQYSRENEDAPTQPVTSQLNIPELAEVEDESEDEKGAHAATPFKSLGNASLDVIFDMSGNGEDLAPTLQSTCPVQRVANNSTDAWTDDDIFTEEVLLQVDNELTLSPRKDDGTIKVTEEAGLPKKSSTPHLKKSAHNVKVNEAQHENAKSYLNFMMDSAIPIRPSPKKNKPSVLKGSLITTMPNQRKTNPSVTAKHTTECNDNIATTSCYATNVKGEDSKTANISIPPEVLEDFMMDDSLTESSNQKIPKTIASSDRNTSRSMNIQGSASLDTKTSANTNHIAQHITVTTRTCISSSTGSQPNKYRKTASQNDGFALSKQPGNRHGTAIDFNNSFSSGDDEMLMEAVALTESQRASQAKSEAAAPAKTPSQPKYSASEIEKKKQIALSRRKLKMQQKLT